MQLRGIRQVAIEYRHIRQRGRPKAKISRWARLDYKTVVPLACIVAGIAGIAYFGMQFFTSPSLQPAKTYTTTTIKQPTAAAQAKPPTLPASEPTHISIDSVGIDADIISVGLDSKGGIELPPIDNWQAGWYKNSPTPGELGPSIIVGHVDTYKGISVFWHLREVKAGDEVRISRADGSTATFVITALAQYDQHNFPTDEVYQNLGYAGLKLITCSGTFDEATQHYTENTVVTATLKL